MQLRTVGLGSLLAWVAAVKVGCVPSAPVASPVSQSVAQRQLTVATSYQTHVLSNGLTVVLAPDADTNLVTVDVRYFSGALDEPASKTGLAHLTEHVLFEISAPSGGTLSARFADTALTYNGYTSFDWTHYTSTAIGQHLETLLALEARRMAAPCADLASEVIEREISIVEQEAAQRGGQAGARQALHTLLWGSEHRLGKTVSGTDVAKLSKEDVCAFAREHYVPARAALIISGAITADAGLAHAARYFERIPRGAAAPARKVVPRAAPVGSRAAILPIAEPGALVAFPLAPVGTAERILQEGAIVAATAELGVAERDAKVASSFIKVVGAQRDAMVVLWLSSTELSAPQLQAKLLETTAKASGYWNDHRLLVYKMQAATELLEAHDSLGKGHEIASYCQYTTHGRYHAMDIDTLMQSDTAAMVAATKALFAPERAFHYRVTSDPGSSIELALTSDTRQYDIPHDAMRASTTATAPWRPAMAHAPYELRLENGLRVVAVPRPSSALFDARMIFRGGRADDPVGKSGTAALLTAVLRERRTGLSLEEEIEQAKLAYSGGQLFSSASERTSTYGVRGPAEMAEQHLTRLHNLLARGGLSLPTLEEIYQADWDERRQAGKSKTSLPSARAKWLNDLLVLEVRKQLFGENHPRARIGNEVENISVEDLQEFRSSHYRTSDAVLVVVGGFDPKALRSQIERLFGPWRPGRGSGEPPPKLDPTKGPSFVALDRPQRQLELNIGFATHPDHGTVAARKVTREIIHARLAVIRQRMAATYGFDVSYELVGDSTVLLINGLVAPNRGAEVLRAVREALDVEKTPTGAFAQEVEVARARRKATEAALARSASTVALADAHAEAIELGLPFDFEGAIAAQLQSIPSAHIRALLRSDLNVARMVISVAGPNASAILRESGASAITVIE